MTYTPKTSQQTHRQAIRDAADRIEAQMGAIRAASDGLQYGTPEDPEADPSFTSANTEAVTYVDAALTAIRPVVATLRYAMSRTEAEDETS